MKVLSTVFYKSKQISVFFTSFDKKLHKLFDTGIFLCPKHVGWNLKVWKLSVVRAMSVAVYGINAEVSTFCVRASCLTQWPIKSQWNRQEKTLRTRQAND